MIPNTRTNVYVTTGSHRYPVRRWTEDGLPEIVGHHGLQVPKFHDWTLEDDGLEDLEGDL